jgi:soluble lytic murein transglycosylase-like protein
MPFESPRRREPHRAARCARCAAALCALAAHSYVAAQVYAGSAEGSGTLVLSNFQSADAPELLIATPDVAANGAVPKAQARSTPPRAKPQPELLRLIDSIAAQVQVSPDLLHAVIAVESNYELRALSPRGAMGLMQLLPATAKRFGAKDPYAAADNILAGASYLKWLMGLFDNELELVLAAYNSGEQAVLKAGRKIPPYAETQAYVPRVLAHLQAASKTPH